MSGRKGGGGRGGRTLEDVSLHDGELVAPVQLGLVGVRNLQWQGLPHAESESCKGGDVAKEHLGEEGAGLGTAARSAFEPSSRRFRIVWRSFRTQVWRAYGLKVMGEGEGKEEKVFGRRSSSWALPPLEPYPVWTLTTLDLPPVVPPRTAGTLPGPGGQPGPRFMDQQQQQRPSLSCSSSSSQANSSANHSRRLHLPQHPLLPRLEPERRRRRQLRR